MEPCGTPKWALTDSDAVELTRRTEVGTCEASRFDSIRFRIVRPIRDSIRIDGPIRNFRIVYAVNRHSQRNDWWWLNLRLVDFWSKISVQQHCLTRFMGELK